MTQVGPPLQSIGSRTYYLSGSIDASGVISGLASLGTGHDEAQGEPRSYVARGNVTLANTGWSASFSLPLREEIAREGHFSITLVLPTTMTVTDVSSFSLPIFDIPKEFFASSSKQELLFVQYLRSRGRMGVSVTMVSGTGASSSYTGVLTLPMNA